MRQTQYFIELTPHPYTLDSNCDPQHLANRSGYSKSCNLDSFAETRQFCDRFEALSISWEFLVDWHRALWAQTSFRERGGVARITGVKVRKWWWEQLMD